MWDKQNKAVPAGSGRYQEGRTGLPRNKKKGEGETEEVEYSCQYRM
jgi:hypothetical protein